MKKQFSRRRSVSGVRTAQRTAWSVAAAAAFIFILVVFRLTLPGVFIIAASPFWRGGTTLDAGVGSVFSGFSSNQKLTQQNTMLSAQVTTLTNENNVLTARAQDLTKLLSSQSSGLNGGRSTGIIAGVLARPPVSVYDTLVVSAGSSDGIASGAEAFGAGGIPLGTVQNVTAHSSMVTLFSTAGMATNAWVGANRTPITLIGMGAGAFTATLSRLAAPAVGDSIYVSGPGAIPVGRVVAIVGDSSSPSVTLQIQPLVNPFSVTWVEIARQ